MGPSAAATTSPMPSQAMGRRLDMRERTASRATIVACAGLLTLGACAAPFGTAMDGAAPNGAAVPEEVVAMAAPYQDVSSARLMPEDGCYWYRHVGPVETTMLPLRTVGGRPICTRGAARVAG